MIVVGVPALAWSISSYFAYVLLVILFLSMWCCTFVLRFIRDEPDKLDNSLKRCKKLTGTLATLRRY